MYKRQEQAFAGVLWDFINGANEDRVEEFITEMPPSQRERLMAQWLEYVRMGGDAADVTRQNEALDQESD